MSKTSEYLTRIVLSDDTSLEFDTFEGVPIIRVFKGNQWIENDHVTRDDVNRIRRWTELAYARGQER